MRIQSMAKGEISNIATQAAKYENLVFLNSVSNRMWCNGSNITEFGVFGVFELFGQNLV